MLMLAIKDPYEFTNIVEGILGLLKEGVISKEEAREILFSERTDFSESQTLFDAPALD